jgi:hypothetical protein
MKRFVMAVALTGLLSVTALAGEIPTNDSPAPSTTSSQSATSTTLAKVVLTIITLIVR